MKTLRTRKPGREFSSEGNSQNEGEEGTGASGGGSGTPENGDPENGDSENDDPQNGDPQNGDDDTTVETITLNETDLKLAIGEQYQLEVSFGSDDVTDQDVIWTSSDDEVAMVDDTGNVTANGFGTATITASTENGKSAECTVEVGSLYYKISYVLNGGTNAEENPATYKRKEAVTLSNPVRKGYVFIGWYEDEELTKKVTGIPAGETGDKVFYAKWVGKTYMIAFDGNSADSGEMPMVTYKVGETGVLPENTFARRTMCSSSGILKQTEQEAALRDKG